MPACSDTIAPWPNLDRTGLTGSDRCGGSQTGVRPSSSAGSASVRWLSSIPAGVLVIETTGRKTGLQRFTPVGYWRDDDGSHVVGGGAAGQTRTPDWVANLRSKPAAAIWINRTRIQVTAKELAGDERIEARTRAATIWRGVPRYERLSGRVIPYFRLLPRTADPTPS
jgi:deazaflavin-dependent oxidoreductase (nitroreductase family)